MRSSQVLCGVVILTLCAAACSTDSATVPEPVDPGVPSLVGDVDWSMADRFGLDVNGDELPDVPNTIEYVLNQSPGSCRDSCRDNVAEFDVTLDAHDVDLMSDGGVPIPITSYNWSVVPLSGADPFDVETSEPYAEVRLPEGDFDIALEVAGEGASGTTRREITIDDVLIVAIGDSYAGGEGNPERPGDPARWADDGSVARTQQAVDHELAHRTTLAASAQAALELERGDSRTSVTFVFLAASGASVTEGVLAAPAAAAPAETEGFAEELRPQIEELEDLLGCGVGSCLRTVDALTMSLGGNDIRFSFAVGTLIALEPQVLLGVYDNLVERLLGDVASRLEVLPDSFAALAGRLEGLDIDDVYLTAYPSGGYSQSGDELLLCEEAGADLVPGLEVDRSELELLDREIIEPLNDVLRDVTATHGWKYVEGHLAAFLGHGYCGSDPYPPNSYRGNPFPNLVPEPLGPEVRWFRQAGESVEIQGGGGFFEPDRLATAGTFHPNELGHRAYAAALVEAISSS